MEALVSLRGLVPELIVLMLALDVTRCRWNSLVAVVVLSNRVGVRSLLVLTTHCHCLLPVGVEGTAFVDHRVVGRCVIVGVQALAKVELVPLGHGQRTLRPHQFVHHNPDFFYF